MKVREILEPPRARWEWVSHKIKAGERELVLWALQREDQKTRIFLNHLFLCTEDGTLFLKIKAVAPCVCVASCLWWQSFDSVASFAHQ